MTWPDDNQVYERLMQAAQKPPLNDESLAQKVFYKHLKPFMRSNVWLKDRSKNTNMYHLKVKIHK